MQKISVILSLLIISNLFFCSTVKLLIINELAKGKTNYFGSFYPNFLRNPYPELAWLDFFPCESRGLSQPSNVCGLGFLAITVGHADGTDGGNALLLELHCIVILLTHLEVEVAAHLSFNLL